MSEALTIEPRSILRPMAVDRVSGLHVLLADRDAGTRGAREQQLLALGHRVSVARTAFEAIVKACCHLPDLVLLDSSLDDDIGSSEAGEFLTSCPLTAHIPIRRLSPRRLVPQRVIAELRRRAR